MKRWLHHPWWTHSPALLLLVGFSTWFVIGSGRWPKRIPLQIGWSGEPTNWGSPWIAFAIVLGMGIFFLALTVLIDSLWAKQESQKRFNVLSLLDELVIALLVTIQVAFLETTAMGESVYRIPLAWLIAVVGGATMAGVIVERHRPFHPSEVVSYEVEGLEGFRRELQERIEHGARVVFWDVQNPKYVTWLSIGVTLVLWISAGFLASSSLWAALIEAAVGLVLLQFYGGQRTRVDADGVTIRYGLAGFRIFRCRLSEITGLHIRSFAPLAEFGGYGIRFGAGVTAYFLAGRTGVQLDFAERRSALIGSNHPERLAAAIEARTGLQAMREEADAR
jgi:hypothetical protein